uniref:MAK10-like protein n=1 Tax=Tanacetum cinerariifolium TaxID=118510 RepID=A0A6L2MPB9_TANCI|nr:hypothetical protein [Tanacetum cinerariifolium]
MRDENPIRTLEDYSKPSHKGYRNTIELPEGNNVENLFLKHGLISRTYSKKSLIMASIFGSKSKSFTPMSIPSQGEPSICRPVICSGPHDTEHYMENLEQAFVNYASSHTEKAGASQDARLSKFKANFKQQQSEMTNKIDTVLKVIIDRIMGSLRSDTVKNPKLNVDSTFPVLSARSYPTGDPQCSSCPLIRSMLSKHIPKRQSFLKGPAVDGLLAHALIYNAILDKYMESLELGKNGSAFVQGEMPKRMEDPVLFPLYYRLGDSKPFDTLADLGSCVNIIPLYLFKKLKIGLLEEIDHVFGLADGRGFLAIANAVIDCRKAKIAAGEGITRSVFRVNKIDLGREEAPYWTTLGKRESYKPRPSSDSVVAQTPYYARKEFMNCHLPGE